MGTGKKEKSRLVRQGKTGDGMGNIKVKGENFYRSAKRVKALNVLKDEGKAIRNKQGKIVKRAAYQSSDTPVAVIEPSRRWFNNSRVISQDSLNAFREAVAEEQRDPYSVLLKSNKLPMSLIHDEAKGEEGLKKAQAKITIESSPYAEVFGPRAQRKRVKIGAASIGDLAGDAEKSMDSYHTRREEIRLLSGNGGGDGGDLASEEDSGNNLPQDYVFTKGTSKRIWNELYKVMDASDVILHILDARDPEGTRCRSIEKYLAKEAPHKHLVFILNKIDCAHEDSGNLGKGAFTRTSNMCDAFVDYLLRQFQILHKDRRQISCGIIGYPNAGKSSLINCLRGKNVAKVAPIPGETKVWQYVTLTRKIYLIDCPGVVAANNGSEGPSELLLRGTVRVERIDNPEKYIGAVLQKVKPQHMQRTYDLQAWKDHLDFLTQLAKKSGRLLKAGEADLDGVAKMVLHDFIRGKIPWFTPPPALKGDEPTTEGGGRLGEMSRKRKRVGTDGIPDVSAQISDLADAAGEKMADEDDEFEGFTSDSESDVVPAADVAGLRNDGGADGEDEDMIPLDSSSDDESEDDGEGGRDDSEDDEGLEEELSGEEETDEESEPVALKSNLKKTKAR